jgi:hypothetical protein
MNHSKLLGKPATLHFTPVTHTCEFIILCDYEKVPSSVYESKYCIENLQKLFVNNFSGDDLVFAIQICTVTLYCIT